MAASLMCLILSIMHPEASIKARQFHFSRLVTRLVTNSEKPLTLRLRMSCTDAPIAFHTMHTLCTCTLCARKTFCVVVKRLLRLITTLQTSY